MTRHCWLTGHRHVKGETWEHNEPWHTRGWICAVCGRRVMTHTDRPPFDTPPNPVRDLVKRVEALERKVFKP